MVYRNQTSTDLNKPKNTYGCFLVCQGQVLDAFRTINWKRIREEIEPFRIMMGQKLLTVNA